MTETLFTEMNLSPEISHALERMEFEKATPIQAKAIPIISSGADLIARSQTGTGKTLAFAIPAIEKIDIEEAKPTIQVVVVCPTRELAMQVYEEVMKLSRFMPDITAAAIYGGAPMDKQCMALRRASIVIGTPGRIMDHMRRKTIRLNDLKLIVLDEADEMLKMGFKEDIETILIDTPDQRQTVMFSATMPPAIQKITKQFQKDPQLIEINKAVVTLGNINQVYVDVPHTMKKDALSMLLQYYKPQRTIIFCATKSMTDELAEYLKTCGLRIESIHSDIKQGQRTNTMNAFKAGRINILLATDIAARGIDVRDIDYVINFDLPNNTEYYIHRIGRTGRAGKEGCSITLCSSRREADILRRIGRAVKSEITELPLPTPTDMVNLAKEKALEEIESAIAGNREDIYSKMVTTLIENGFSPESIAASALSLNYSHLEKIKAMPQIQENFHRQSLIDSTNKPGTRNSDSRVAMSGASKKHHPHDKHKGMYETVHLDIGKTKHIRAIHIVGTISKKVKINARDIGDINVSSDHSLIELPAGKTDEILKAMKGASIFGEPVNFNRLEDSSIKPKHKCKPRRQNGAKGNKSENNEDSHSLTKKNNRKMKR